MDETPKFIRLSQPVAGNAQPKPVLVNVAQVVSVKPSGDGKQTILTLRSPAGDVRVSDAFDDVAGKLGG